MLDFDAAKLLIIGVVALIVIGPKDLPRVLRQVGQAVSRVRRMATEFQGQFMDAMREADLEAIREDLKKSTADAGLDVHFDPARDIQRELTGSVDLAAATTAPSGDTAVAAFEPVMASATDGFALPGPAEALADAGDAGAVPVVTETGTALAVQEDVGIGDDRVAPTPARGDAPIRKRRIRVLRRPTPSRRVHAVLDRTGRGPTPGWRGRTPDVAARGANP